MRCCASVTGVGIGVGWLTSAGGCPCALPLMHVVRADVVGDATKQQSQVGAMELGRGRSRPPWRDASGEGGLWPLCQAVYAVTIPTWLGGVGGAAIPTSGAVGGGGARQPAERAFI